MITDFAARCVVKKLPVKLTFKTLLAKSASCNAGVVNENRHIADIDFLKSYFNPVPGSYEQRRPW